ncbi:FAD-dependent oxidoreductase [Cohnella caldifontis]|uniref:FAD-dependent oxidoreductase n=1 Tax=Cohnella caldifontis TaxID=3027471 RepID=UPI0023EDC181|nr:FAD-dependent oxidoreductase [Cohnella sp. YIM B05605]
MKKIRIPERQLPILGSADAVVIGGSYAGVAAALALAREGLKVWLAEPRTFLGREITAAHRYWMSGEEAKLHELAGGSLQAAGSEEAAAGDDGGETALHPDRVKLYLEDRLAEAGVNLLYATLPVRIEREAFGRFRVAIANKSGLQLLTGGILIDATETAVTSFCGPKGTGGAMGLRGASAAGQPETARYARVLEFTGYAGNPITEPAELRVPAALGIADHRIVLRRGCRGAGHVLAEMVLELPAESTCEASHKRESEARHRSMALAAYLIAETEGFGGAFFAAASTELLGPLPVGIKDNSAQTLGPESFARAGGIWYASGAGLPDRRWLNAGTAAAEGERLAYAALEASRTEKKGGGSETGSESLRGSAGDDSEPPLPCTVHMPVSPQQGKPYPFAPFGSFDVPLAGESDVLVAGGGTSGATAAITAGREGARTLVLEGNDGLGGTGTVGGVDSYWFGRRVGFAERITALVETQHRRLRYTGGKWNIEAKKHALLQETEEAGVKARFHAIVFAALKQGDNVRGVLAATRWGPAAYVAGVTIDATGDGDLAAFAGADFVYGSERDRTVMWYSLAQFEKPGRTQNNFTSMVDVSNIEDYTRAILTGRRRGRVTHDHGVYVATRESRHIRGDVVMTLADQLLGRLWPDVVNVHFSNHDIKGLSTADWVNVGAIPPNLFIEIPYRMLLPQGLEGILVVGKAISATHDALPAIRMQSDLENLGGAAALAAVHSLRQGVSPRRVDIRQLQRRLSDAGLLPADTPERKLAPIAYDADALERLADGLTGDLPLYHYSNMRMNETFQGSIPFAEICSAGPAAIPVLEKAMAEAEGRRQVHLAQALAMLGSPAAVPVLLADIERLLAAGPSLPERRDDFMYVQLPPDHGAMPDLAYLLHSLALTADPRGIPVWEAVADRLHPAEDDFKDMLKCTFYYVQAVCLGAERLGSPAMLPALRKLHGHHPLRNLACRDGLQPDYFEERRALLELMIGRSMARCGDPEGYRILISYLDDVRALLSEHAHAELASISERDFGKDPCAWSNWLDAASQAQAGAMPPCPFQTRYDRVSDSSVLLRRVV